VEGKEALWIVSRETHTRRKPMSEMLMSILDKMLSEAAVRIQAAQALIGQRKGTVFEAQKDLRTTEDRLKCAVYEDEQALQKLDTLRTYLTRLGKHPQALMIKVGELRKEQDNGREFRRRAEEQVAHVKSELQEKQTWLAIAEKDYVGLQGQWNEVSELVSHERAKGK
jgi:chromosome segregation ATPase